jgi:FixJ family two-component response regulator
MTLERTTVFIVDDDSAVLTAISRLLRSAGFRVAPFASAELFADHHDPDVPGCLILDVSMPGLNGLDLQEWLAKHDSTLPIIFLTGHGDVTSSVRAMKLGAVDFLTKPVDEKVLVAAVCQALDRNRAVRTRRQEVYEIERKLNKLTPREREVLDHVVAGELNKQVAADLGTVEKTIKVHRGRVMAKMGVRSLAELVRMVERAGGPPATAPQAAESALSTMR